MRSLMPFTLPDNPQFYGVGVFLPNILIIGLFVSNSRMVILFRTKKNSHHSKHSMDHLFMTMARGGLVTCFQILLFLSKISTVHFYGWKEWVVTKLVILCSCEKCMIPTLAYQIIVLSTPRLLFVEKFCTPFPPPSSPPLPRFHSDLFPPFY